MKEPALESGNIRLRRLQKSDAPQLAELANDKRIWDNLRDYFPHPYRLKDAQDFISRVSQEDPVLTFAVIFDEQFAGIAGLHSQQDVYRKSKEIGYWIGAPFWGKGIATNAVKLLSAYAFDNLACHRLQAGVYSYNPASMKVLENAGYLKEGIFEQAVWKNEEFWDEHRYALLNPSV